MYLAELDPIVWIPSRLWFTFLKQRVIEISTFQKKLSNLAERPKNYGLITAILSYMLQHVGISPIIKDRDVVQALADLHFDQISQRFGCFFLHDLNLANGQLPGIQDEDPAMLLWMLKGDKVVSDKPKSMTGTEALSPLAITWKQLCESLNQPLSQNASMNPFIWDATWLMYSTAEALFCSFTSQFWMMIANSGFQPLDHQPTTLKEAMELWTLESVKARIKYEVGYHLVPSGDGLNGAVPDKHQRMLFEFIRDDFFPEPGTAYNGSSVWSALYRVGYVRDYHRAIAASGDGGQALKDGLDGIFANLQLLPYNPGRPNSTVPLWRWKNSVVTLIANSSHIWLLDRTIKQAEGGGVWGQGHKKLVSAAQLEKMLRKKEPWKVQVQKSKVNRRGKSKNWRQPPKRRTHPKITDQLAEEGGDELSEGMVGGLEAEGGD